MNSEKEKWFEEVFQSMEGAQKAKPRPEVLAKIERKIAESNQNSQFKPTVISLTQLRKYAAAAAILLLMNASALMYYSQENVSFSENMASVDTQSDSNIYNESYITSFQLYN
jgi:hypothetical protein